MFFVVAVITAVAAANAQSPFFKKCEDAKGVTTVLVTKAMLKMVGSTPGMNMDGYSQALIKDKLDCVEVITSTSAEGRAFLRKEADAMFNAKKGYELLMKVKVNGEGDDVKIMKSPLKGGKNHFVVIAGEPSEMVIVSMEGTLTLEDVLKCTKR